MGGGISFQTLLIDPFFNGHQFVLNMPMWFIAPLLFAEMINVLIRAATKSIPSSLKKEICILATYLILGAIAIKLGGSNGLESGFLLLLSRTLFFLACLGMGRFYAVALEKHDSLPNVLYFAILLPLQLIIILSANGNYAYTVSWCQFPGGILCTYAVTITGIAFLLRCCRMLSRAFGRSRFVLALADNTFSIMCHHMLGFFLVCSSFAFLATVTPWFSTFDLSTFLSKPGYRWMPASVPQMAFVYAAVGIVISLIIHFLWEKLKHRGSEILYKIKSDVMH